MSTSGMQLSALIYASDAIGSAGEPELEEILAQARARNERLGITGILLYRDGRFVQYLEGPAEAVREVFASISADPRHERVRVLLDSPVESRRFTSWTMGYEPLRAAAAPPPAGFRDTFATLERADRVEQVLQAMDELALWFRVRSLHR
ncbi:BLUF domain-containing protein [Leucobacter zeae]|nr:BLUF domain-containing protein [Leucobacter zeae]